jgi:hypothetical protein
VAALSPAIWELVPLVSGRKSARSRIVRVLLAVCVALLFIGWIVRAYGRFGAQLSALGGLALGDTRGDIRYKLGVPPVVFDKAEAGETGIGAYYTSTDPEKDPVNALPEGADINSYPIWSYTYGPSPGPHVDLTFDASTGRISKISCIDSSDPPTSYCGRIVGAGIGDPEFRIAALFGSPLRQSIDDRSGVKTMDYSDIGVLFLLARQRVYGISVVGSGAHKQPPLHRFLLWFTSDLRT